MNLNALALGTIVAKMVFSGQTMAGNEYGRTIAASCVGDAFHFVATGADGSSPGSGFASQAPAPEDVGGQLQSSLDGIDLVLSRILGSLQTKLAEI